MVSCSKKQTKRSVAPMAYHKNTVNLEKMLLKFLGEPDPML